MEKTLETNEPILVLELADRAKSGFVLKGTEGTLHENRLDAPRRHRILPNSSYLNEKGELVHIRYIQGCDTILVSEQKRRGIEFNPKRDQIVFDGTIKTVIRRGKDTSLFDYLAACHYNEHAPNKPHEESIRFREIRTEELAKEDLTNFKMESAARRIVDELYDENAAGDFVHDEHRVNAICQTLGIHMSTPAEKIQAIIHFSKIDPGKFVKTLADRTVGYRTDVMEAIRLGILQVSGKVVTMVSTNEVIHKTKSAAREQQLEEMARFLLYPENHITYQTMMANIQVAKDALINPA